MVKGSHEELDLNVVRELSWRCC